MSIFMAPPYPYGTRLNLTSIDAFFNSAKQHQKICLKGRSHLPINYASKDDGNAIFTSILQTCQKSGNKSETLLDWPNFKFTGNSSTFITTNSIKIMIKEEEWNNIQPGMKFYVSLKLLDEMGQHVEAPVDISLEPEEKVYIKIVKL